MSSFLLCTTSLEYFRRPSFRALIIRRTGTISIWVSGIVRPLLPEAGSVFVVISSNYYLHDVVGNTFLAKNRFNESEAPHHRPSHPATGAFSFAAL